MTLDDALLATARDAGGRMEAAEREAKLARAEYHTAVRRLHLGGASLREIAGALGISHQRVQQIVDAAGGSWWKRVWKSRSGRAARDAVCTFCGKPPSEVARLIAGPNVYVCDGCVSWAERHTSRRRGTCSFCGKKTSVAVRGEGATCAPCLKLCRGILDDRAP